jgi:hypothetical protein
MLDIALILERLLMAQSDLQAKALQSGHPDAGGMYHATVRLSLEPDCPILGAIPDAGDFMKKPSVLAAGMSAQIFRTVTNNTLRHFVFSENVQLTFEFAAWH